MKRIYSQTKKQKTHLNYVFEILEGDTLSFVQIHDIRRETST